jgi:hypothetical protein
MSSPWLHDLESAQDREDGENKTSEDEINGTSFLHFTSNQIWGLDSFFDSAGDTLFRLVTGGSLGSRGECESVGGSLATAPREWDFPPDRMVPATPRRGLGVLKHDTCLR